MGNGYKICKICRKYLGNSFGYCSNCWNKINFHVKKDMIIKDEERRGIFNNTLNRFLK